MILAYIPAMDNVEFVIVCALFGVLILWFGVYLWRQIRDRDVWLPSIRHCAPIRPPLSPAFRRPSRALSS